jgi:hypothetical protein
MASVYGRVAKISNAVGRSNYINDEERQEEIVLHKENMQHSWEEHSSFEKEHQKTNVANNEALEVHVALPNSLAQEKEKLEQVCDDLANEIVGDNKDYEYSVHWNHNRTNLHVHILFSERENQIDLEPKVYKKDIWQDRDTHRLAKAHAENAELVHKKGDIQRDKEGNIKYQTDIFKAKDTKFIQSSFVHEKNRIVEKVMKSYGYNLEYQDKNSPYLAQKKLYKGASQDYLEKAKEWNAEVQRYNKGVKQHIELEPIQLENYRTIKKEVLENVKEANAEEKKITPRAIELVKDMADWIHQTLLQLKVFVKRKARELETMKVWEQIKDQFSDMFEKNKELEKEIKGINQQIDNFDKVDKEFTEVIQSKNELIHDIETYHEQKAKLFEEVKKLEPKAYKGYSRDEYIKEIQGLTYEQRIEKARDMIEQQRQKLERIREYEFER